MSDNPFVKPITDSALVWTRPGMVVLLERVEPGVTPDYCVHGKTTCYRCDDWCWLGSETYETVRAGNATPLCMQCAAAVHAEHPDAFDKPIGHLDDHRA